ncbi:MAG: hypothetical protein ACRDBQ_18025 [Shewanella sp.]
MSSRESVSAAVLVETYRSLLIKYDHDALDEFVSMLKEYLASSRGDFPLFYSKDTTIRMRDSRPTTKSFVRALLPELSEIPIQVLTCFKKKHARLVGAIRLIIPFNGIEKRIDYYLQTSEALLVGDFPLAEDNDTWLVMQNKEIGFVHPTVPVEFRGLVVSDLSSLYGWTASDFTNKQVLLISNN